MASRLAQAAEFVEVANRVGGAEAAKELARDRRGEQFDPAVSRRDRGGGRGDPVRSRHAGQLGCGDRGGARAGDRGLWRALRRRARWPWRASWTSSRRISWATRAPSRSLPARRGSGSACPIRRSARCGAPVSCTTSGGWGSRTRSWTSAVRLPPAIGSAFAWGRTSPSGCCGSRRRSPRLRRSPFSTASVATAPGIRAASRATGSPSPRACWARPTPTRRCASRARTAPRCSAEAAAAELRADVKAGRLDADAVEAVLGAAGHRVSRRHGGPGGAHAARGGGAQAACPRALQQGDRRAPRDLTQDRGQPRRAHLREDRSVDARGSRAVRDAGTGSSRRRSSPCPVPA